MTDTNTITEEQQDHSTAQLPETSWQAILSYVSGRLQRHSDESELMRWQMIRFAAFMRFSTNDALRTKAIMTAIESGLLKSEPTTMAQELAHILDEIDAGEARVQAVIHG